MTQTDWSMIRRAVQSGEDASAAMELLARRYWPAVYAYIRSTGRNGHEALDLTQGFVCDVIISRGLFEAADPGRGRFRALLLEALRNYLREVHRKQRAVVRGGAAETMVLDPSQMSGIDAGADRSPEHAFAVEWSATLVRRVLDQVRQSCTEDGLEPHWVVFEWRVARPMLFGEAPLSYPELVERLDLKESSQAANMMVTVKRRFARELYVEVCRTVGDPDEARSELNDLLQTLGAAGLPQRETTAGHDQEPGS